jgi:hypothetical protein
MTSESEDKLAVATMHKVPLESRDPVATAPGSDSSGSLSEARVARLRSGPYNFKQVPASRNGVPYYADI